MIPSSPKLPVCLTFFCFCVYFYLFTTYTAYFLKENANRRLVLENFATRNGFDPLLPSNWYSIPSSVFYSDKVEKRRGEKKGGRAGRKRDDRSKWCLKVFRVVTDLIP